MNLPPSHKGGGVTVRIYKAPSRGELYMGRFLDGPRKGQAPNLDDVQARMVKVWGGVLTPFATDSHAFLEALWKLVEEGGPKCEAHGIPRLAKNPASITSFTVGDVVVLGDDFDQTWLCDDFGWKLLGETRVLA